MSSFYIGATIGFALGGMAGIILAAIIVAAGRENDRIMAEQEFPELEGVKPE